MTRRHVITGMLVAVTAVVLNCAVAGACAWFVLPDFNAPAAQVSQDTVARHLRTQGIPIEFTPSSPSLSLRLDEGLGWSYVAAWGGESSKEQGVYVVRAGMPWRCLVGADTGDRFDPWHIMFLKSGPYGHQLPLGIVWPPFIANCAIYAIILTTIVLGPRTILRARRLASGRCFRCRYPLRTGSIRCSECGVEVPVPGRVGDVPRPVRVSGALATVLLALLTGALLTVLSGWCMALTVPTNRTVVNDAAVVSWEHGTRWRMDRYDNAVHTRIVIRWGVGWSGPNGMMWGSSWRDGEGTLLPSWITIQPIVTKLERSPEDARRYEAVGWPLRCLWGEERIFLVPGWPPMRIGAIPLRDRTGATLLPLRPIWPGFAVNTGLWALLLLAIVTSRQWFRGSVPRLSRRLGRAGVG